MAKRPGWHAIYVIAIVGIAFAGNSLLIPRYGLTGAAIATACAVTASALLLRVLVRWRVGVRI